MAQGEENNRLGAGLKARKGATGHEKHVGELMQALMDEHWDARRRAAYALGNLGESAVEPLIRALTNDRWDIRRKAAWALGNIGDPRAVEPLLHTLKDDRAEVREQAAWALGALRDFKALEPLIQVLSDADSSVRRQAARSLAVFSVLNEHLVKTALQDYESGLTDEGREHFRQYRDLYERARQKARITEH